MPVISSLFGNPPVSKRAILPLAALASTVWIPCWLAKDFPRVIPLSSLDGMIGYRLDGGAAYDRVAYSVSSAGDVNGDGFDDVIIGAPFTPSGSGSSYVVFGKA